MGILQEASITDEVLDAMRKGDVNGKPSSPEDKEKNAGKQEADDKLDKNTAHTLYYLYLNIATSLNAPIDKLKPLYVPASLSDDSSVMKQVEELAENAIHQHDINSRAYRLFEMTVDPKIFDKDTIKELTDKWLKWFTDLFKAGSNNSEFMYMTDFKEALDKLGVDDMVELWEAMDASTMNNGELTDSPDWESYKKLFKDSCEKYEDFLENGGKTPETEEELVAKDNALSADECTNLYGVFKFIKSIYYSKGEKTRVLNHPENLDEPEDSEDFVFELDEAIQIRTAQDSKKNSDNWTKWVQNNFNQDKGKMYFVQLKELLDGLPDEEKVSFLYAMDVKLNPNKHIDTPSTLENQEGWDEFTPYMSNAVDIYEKETFSGQYARSNEQIQQLGAMAGMINAIYGLDAMGKSIIIGDGKSGGPGAFSILKGMIGNGIDALNGLANKLNSLTGKGNNNADNPPPKPTPEEQQRINTMNQWINWVIENLSGETEYHMDKVFRTDQKANEFFKATASILSAAPDASNQFNNLTTGIYSQAQEVAKFDGEGTSQIIVNKISDIINSAFSTGIQIANAIAPGEDDEMISHCFSSVKDDIKQYISAFKNVKDAMKSLGSVESEKQKQVATQMGNVFSDFMKNRKKKNMNESILHEDNNNNPVPATQQNSQPPVNNQVQPQNNNNQNTNQNQNQNNGQRKDKFSNFNEDAYITIAQLQEVGGFDDLISSLQGCKKDGLYRSELDLFDDNSDEMVEIWNVNPEIKVSQTVLDGETEEGKTYSLDDMANLALYDSDYQVVVGIMVNPEIFGDNPREQITGEEVEECINDPEEALNRLKQNPQASLTNLSEITKTDYQVEWEERTKKWGDWIKGLKGKNSRDVKGAFDQLGESGQADLMLFLDKTMEKQKMSFEKMNKKNKNVLMMYLPAYSAYLTLKKMDDNNKKLDAELRSNMKESSIVLTSCRVQHLVDTNPFRKSYHY